MTRRLWDCFMFRDETDMLAMRVHTLAGKVHAHVLVESTVTHTGLPKPLRYAQGPHHPHVLPVAASPGTEDHPGRSPSWAAEHWQRQQAWQALGDAADGDVLLICDADEIPSNTALFAAMETVTPSRPLIALEMRVFAFAVDWEFTTYRQLTAVLALAGHARTCGATLGDLRDGRDHYPRIRGGGWHFTWLGGPEAIREKVAASCHSEQVARIAEANDARLLYEQGHSVWTEPLRPVEVNRTWPEYIHQRRCPPRWFRPRSVAG